MVRAALLATRTRSVYRSYYMCNGTERVSWVLDQFYLAYNRDASACAQGGGVLQAPTPPDKMDGMCRTLLAQAGPDGMGNVTYNPYPLGADASESRWQPEGRGGLESAASKAAVGVGGRVGRRRVWGAAGVAVRAAAEAEAAGEGGGGGGGKERRRGRRRAGEEDVRRRRRLDPGSEWHELGEMGAAKKHELEDTVAAAEAPGARVASVLEGTSCMNHRRRRWRLSSCTSWRKPDGAVDQAEGEAEGD